MRLPPGVVSHEASFWIEAYRRGAAKALGHDFTFPRTEYGAVETLADIVATRCPDKARTDEWLEALVERFVR
jgi:hypothetical protein